MQIPGTGPQGEWGPSRNPLIDACVFLHAHVYKNAWGDWKVFANPQQESRWGGHGAGRLSHGNSLEWRWCNFKINTVETDIPFV